MNHYLSLFIAVLITWVVISLIGLYYADKERRMYGRPPEGRPYISWRDFAFAFLLAAVPAAVIELLAFAIRSVC